MKRELKLALSTAVVAALAIVGPALCLNLSPTRQPRLGVDGSRPIVRSVIKVHTDHGVITLPGTADSWDAAEHAVFLADSIADVQIVNSEIPWRISIE
jgi:hypothetical protein